MPAALTHHYEELARLKQCRMSRAWRQRRDAGEIQSPFWWEKTHGPKRTVPHPEGHRNSSVLYHQHRRTRSGATIVRGGVLKMPPLARTADKTPAKKKGRKK